MRRPGSIRGFSSGVVVGVLIGSAGMSAAALGYKAWSGFSEDLRNGYVMGFMDMTNLARNLDPGGWVDQKYPYVPKARPLEWRQTADKLYADPENQKYNIESILQLVTHELQKKYGEISPAERSRQIMQERLEKVHRKQVEAARANGLPPPPPLVLPKDDVVAPKTPPRALRKERRKWCRCDCETRELKRPASEDEAAPDAGTTRTDAATKDAVKKPESAGEKKADAPKPAPEKKADAARPVPAPTGDRH